MALDSGQSVAGMTMIFHRSFRGGLRFHRRPNPESTFDASPKRQELDSGFRPQTARAAPE